MKKLIGLVIVLVFLVTGCGEITNSSENLEITEPPLLNTATLSPTNTPKPTITTKPTSTPRPTATFTPVPEPVTYEGSGDKIVTLEEPLINPQVVEITNSGSSNFVIKSYDQSGNYIDLLVNEIGSYHGKLLIGMMASEEPVSRFEVTSSGEWQITLYPFTIDYMDTIEVPGKYEGYGDSVVVIIGVPDIAVFSTTEQDNFIVYAFTNDGRQLILNEIGPYSGEKLLPSDAVLITVLMNGTWTMDITSKN